MAFSTRARVELLTTLALFSTRETVAVETLARRATCSRFMRFFHCRRFFVTFLTSYKEFNVSKQLLTGAMIALTLDQIVCQLAAVCRGLPAERKRLRRLLRGQHQ